LLGLGCLQSARAQTLELSGSYPFSIQAAMYGISLSDAISLDLAASTDRLKLEAAAILDLAPVGNINASASLEFAYVGRLRARIATQATLGSATVGLGAWLWSAAPANFDQFEVYGADPLPNSASGSRVDLNMGLRISRPLSLLAAFRFGSDISSVRLGLRLRQSDLEWYTGIYSVAQVGGSVYLLQTSLGLPLFETMQLSLTGGVGFFDANFAFEAGGQLAWSVFENLQFNLAVAYQPWRFDVLPLRSSVGLEFAPGFGVLYLNGFAGRTQNGIIGWGLRLTYRVTLEELFPSQEARK
ncbi:MAG: hypothetical protein ACK41E_09600, partial [Deinococcales bacterium]